MNRSHIWQNRGERQQSKSARGFSLIELAFVVMIVLIMTAMAIPLVNNVTSYFRLRGAISSVTGAIQATRYQAIFQGCPYQLVFLAAANTYQIQNQCPAGGPVGPAVGAFVNVCTPPLVNCPVPLSGSGIPVTLNADITLTFSPGGRVTSATAPMSMVLTYGGKPPETITVSTYGNINVNP
ncbi:MAG TPA: prepilin-type N-terminal cleavage/methylation domain-containing protein [Candidatus Angelobacter sp.]